MFLSQALVWNVFKFLETILKAPLFTVYHTYFEPFLISVTYPTHTCKGDALAYSPGRFTSCSSVCLTAFNLVFLKFGVNLGG